eukprot:1050325-Prymnesium_polylepis.1
MCPSCSRSSPYPCIHSNQCSNPASICVGLEMGVPGFFSWLVTKYDDILVEEGMGIRLKTDQLFIDMNGILHQAYRQQGTLQPTEEEMHTAICAAVRRVVQAVRPRTLLYLAIDGVAPRAKMNQQRARRFLKSREEEERLQEAELLFQKEGTDSSLALPTGFDSNMITPGTEWMERIADNLRSFIRVQMSVDAAWRGLR